MFLLFGYPFGTLNLSSLLRRYIEYYYRSKHSIVAIDMCCNICASFSGKNDVEEMLQHTSQHTMIFNFEISVSSGTLNKISLLRRCNEYYYRFKDSIVVSYTNHNSHITDSIQNAVQATID